MSNIDTTKFDKLLAEGNLEEARAFIKDALESGMTKEERGKLLVQFASAYTKVNSVIDEAYGEVLDSTIEHLKTMKKDEEAMVKEIAEKA